MSATSIEALVEGGKATPGPPLGPALGPLGVNVKAIVDKINEVTKDFTGMKVPVTIIIQLDKTYDIEVGVPPTSALLAKEAGVEKGSGTAGTEVPADIKMNSIIKVAKMKEVKSAPKKKGSFLMGVFTTALLVMACSLMVLDLMFPNHC